MHPRNTLADGQAANGQSFDRKWDCLRIFLIFGLPLFWVVAIVLSRTEGQNLFLRLTREDGAIEDLEFAVLIAAAAVTGAIAWKLWRNSKKFWALIYAGAALGFILIGGEEISWGQRIFGVQTSDFFKENNKQKETNLHNLKFIMPLAPHIISGVLLGLIVLSIRSLRLERAGGLRGTACLWMPPAMLLPAWLCFLSYRGFRTVRSFVHLRSTLALSRLEEPAELIFYTGLLAFAIVVLRRVRQDQHLEPPERRV